MTKGVPNARHMNLTIATNEARRVLLLTKSWARTQSHMDQWLRIKFALTTRSVNDYMSIVRARLNTDAEVAKALGQASVQSSQPAATFVKASEIEKP